MTKKDILELKRRMKKNECTFTRMCGCYVGCDKTIITNLNETFLNLKEEEFYKYLEIAKKTLSGTVGNNLLELEFPLEEESAGGRQQFLMALKASRLKDPELLETFYHLIINSYDYAGNYLILIFHDAYDVMTKTSDNNKLDESEEVYEYLLCAICPVTLTKPGLGYLEDENRIGPRYRDWIVNVPDTGFVFPAFTDRSSDIHSVMYFTKDAKEPHKEFMDTVLGCPVKQTATEQKNMFQTIITNAISDDDEREQIMMDIQESLNQMMDDHAVFNDAKEDPLVLTKDSIQEVLSSTGLDEEVVTKIETSYSEKFGDTPPVADHLLDSKLLAANAQKKREKELVEQVITLQEKIEEITGVDLSSDTDTSSSKVLSTTTLNDDQSNAEEEEKLVVHAEANANDDLDDNVTSIEDVSIKDTENVDSKIDDSKIDDTEIDVILKVKPQKMEQITYQIINGKKCIIIPMDEDEHANVNGITDLL